MTTPEPRPNFLWDDLHIDQTIDVPYDRTLSVAEALIQSQALPIEGTAGHGAESILFALQSILNYFPGAGSSIQQISLECTSCQTIAEPHSLRLTVIEKLPAKTVKIFVSVVDEQAQVICDGFALVQPPQKKRGPSVALSSSGRRHTNYKLFLGRVKHETPVPTAVVFPCDDVSLQACREAVEEGLIEPILIGPAHKIQQNAERLGWDIGGYSLRHVEHAHAASALAMELVHRNEAHLVMKGSLHTDELLREVVKPQTGLRTGRRISHVFVIDVPGMDRPLFISDAAINIAPDLKTKVDITQNAIDLARVLGNDCPKVAILSAIETVNPDLPSSVDAALLAKMAERHQITGGTVDGPLAMDNAINVRAAQTKGIQSAVAGNADILIVPNIEAGNMLVKELTFLGNADCAGIVLGAKVPIILTSRADNVISRLASCAVAVLLHQYHQHSQ
jgi:phosphate acetyltransferase